MGRVRPSFSRSTRGAKNKSKDFGDSSSSNPSTTKHRAAYNNLNAIAKGAPAKKSKNKQAMKKITQEAIERRQMLDRLDNINMDTTTNGDDSKAPSVDESRCTKASFASIWSHCSNSSFDPFFRAWNPNSDLHKETLAVIAGTTQLLDTNKREQTDEEYCNMLMKVLQNESAGDKIITGTALALSFVMRQATVEDLKKNYDSYYAVLSKALMTHSKGKNRSLKKSLIRCLSSLARAAPQGKRSFEPKLRKRINIMLRHLKLQSKVQL